SAMVFLLTSLTPGDPSLQLLGPEATIEQRAQLRQELGLEEPVFEQYGDWASAAVTGDLGRSIVTKQPVTDAIVERFPVTMSIVIGTLLVSVIVGAGLGIASAVRGGWFGRLIDALAMLGLAIPVFWLGAELIAIFAVKLGWFPVTGYVTFAESPSDWFRSLVLPVVALASVGVAQLAKFTREAMLDALGSEYVRMARANGISSRSIVFRHALKSASVQIVTLTGLVTITLLVGSVFVETVFALPGLGSLIVSAVNSHDLPMVQGVAVVFTLIVIVVNLLVDVAYGLLNPKVRTS
ncbi:MAG TPA: ABC transporter permease, partial [Conexibacter sp.]|nr:ABC transporter permease [Conexibacter sp.]